MTADDIRNVTFEHERKGYRAEDVDDFLQQVADDLDRAYAERDAAVAARNAALAERGGNTAEQQSLIAAKEDAENKMYILAEKVEEYRNMEDTLKTALINAQRMGEIVVKEAKQKADQMLREATGQAELLRQKAEAETLREQSTLENLVSEVSKFKGTILNLYKQHIESLSALDPPVARAEEVLGREPGEDGDEEKEAPAAEEPEAVYGSAEPEIPAAPQPAGEAFGGTPLTPAEEQE